MEEDHYYPFGLTLNTTSNNLLTGQLYKYQGIEVKQFQITSQTNKKMKLLLPFFLLISLASCTAREPDIFILPDNFRGGILIIYNQKNGIAPQYHRKSRVYVIPKNGILKTQFSIDSDWSALPQFYYSSISSANRIRYVYDAKEIPENDVIAFGGSSGVANKDLAGKQVIRFATYYIGNKSIVDTAYQRLEDIDIISLAE
ncbi:hypothetical protein F0919_02455 [Taibaiella lutea]|uniref:DUF6843 domain-containing protein n=1 Tax=Taibaiella lutea TaxID=2608001 RepID=A0A5M6CTQ7_9BACT|nr:hypothetical protein [Taibaiella lutea]KAA5536549.1 hypothetical protein F0919_02455 [Taibaiella lutea]